MKWSQGTNELERFLEIYQACAPDSHFHVQGRNFEALLPYQCLHANCLLTSNGIEEESKHQMQHEGLILEMVIVFHLCVVEIVNLNEDLKLEVQQKGCFEPYRHHC